MSLDTIHLHQMMFYGYHGALPEEKKLGQRFIVDITLFTDLRKAGQSDRLTDTINYAEVYHVVKELVEGPGFNLLEALGETIAQRVLQLFAVAQVAVTIKKPAAPIVGAFEYAEVSILRGRQA
jgi:dihydroneopterin aldolase